MQRRISSGFTLVEIMAGVAVGAAGIAAAIAVPAYKDFAVRSQVSDLVIAAARCKTSVSEFYIANGRLPDSAKEAGCPENVTSNANPMAVYNGEILVQAVGALATQLGTKNMFAYRALCADGECAGAPLQGWTCSASSKFAASTSIPPKYLPSACR